MTDIELVVKIPEKTYKHIMSMQFYISGLRSGKSVLEEILKAIRTSTPLSKGHDDLKDMNDIYEAIEGRVDDTDLIMDSIECQVPTIIEADRSEK